MCELKRRLVNPKGKIVLDTVACTLQCGDDEIVSLLAPEAAQ